MISRSGIGFNHTTNMIEATDEAWKAYTKVDLNARLMRFKTYPYYHDWVEIFGRDRATGEHAEDVMEAVNELLFADKTQNEFTEPFNMEETEFCDDTDSMSVSQPSNGVNTSKKSCGKKKKVCSE